MTHEGLRSSEPEKLPSLSESLNQPAPNNTPAPAADSGSSVTWRERTYRYFFGDDIFISYARADAEAYAQRLANRLTRRKFLCYLDQLDQEGTDVRPELTEKLKKKIRNSTIFVLIGTEAAVRSPYVLEELRLFQLTNRPFVPIDVGGTLLNEVKWREIVGLAKTREDPERLRLGNPNPRIINLIRDSFGYRRRTQWLRLFLQLGALFAVLLIAASVGGSTAYSLLKINQAEARARTRIDAANQQVAKAETTRDQATIAAINADIVKTTADIKAGDSEGKRASAEQDAATAEQRRQLAAAEAEKQGEIASAIQLSNQSQAMRGEDATWLEPSTLMSLESINQLRRNQFLSPEADQTLRSSLKLLRQQVEAGSPLAGLTASVNAVALTADGRYLAIANSSGVRVRDWVGDQDFRPTALEGLDCEALTFDGDGKYLITVTRGAASVWQGWQTDKPDVAWSGPQNPNAAKHLVVDAFSPGSRYLVSASPGDLGKNTEVVIWNILSRETKSLSVPPIALSPKQTGSDEPADDYLRQVAISADGRLVALSYAFSGINIWDVDRQGVFAHLPFSEREAAETFHVGFTEMAFSPRGKYLAAALDEEIIIWELHPPPKVDTGARKEARAEPVTGVPAKGSASSGFEQLSNFTETPDRVARLTQGRLVSAVAFSPDEQFLATSGTNETARLWSLENFEEVARISTRWSAVNNPYHGSGYNLNALNFSADSHYLALGASSGAAQVWNITDSIADRPLVSAESGHVAISPSGKYFAQVGLGGLKVWNTVTRKLELSEKKRGDEPEQIRISPDDRYVAFTASGDVWVWSLATSEILDVGLRAYGLVFNPAGNYVAGVAGNVVEACQIEDCQHPASLPFTSSVTSFALSPGGKYVAGVDRQGHLKIASIANPAQEVSLPLRGFATVVTWNPVDDEEIAVATKSGMVEQWNLTTRKKTGEIKCKEAVIDVAYTPTGRAVIAVAGHELVAWRQGPVRSVRTSKLHRDYATLAITPDGNYVAVTERDNTSEIFYVPDAQKVAHIKHPDGISDTTFSRDGKYLMVASRKMSSVQSWLWNQTDLQRDVCQRITRNLSDEEWASQGGRGAAPCICRKSLTYAPLRGTAADKCAP